jgi:hypothetical protein
MTHRGRNHHTPDLTFRRNGPVRRRGNAGKCPSFTRAARAVEMGELVDDGRLGGDDA